MKYLPLCSVVLFAFLLGSCSIAPSDFNPFSWGGDAEVVDTPTPDTDPVTATASRWVDMLVKFGWFGIVLMFVVPGVRIPFVALWTAIFRALTIPFEFMRMKWELYRASKKG